MNSIKRALQAVWKWLNELPQACRACEGMDPACPHCGGL